MAPAAPRAAGPDTQTSIPPAGGGRFLKTLLCVHDEGGSVVVKVRQSHASGRRSAPTTPIRLAPPPRSRQRARGAGGPRGSHPARAVCSGPVAAPLSPPRRRSTTSEGTRPRLSPTSSSCWPSSEPPPAAPPGPRSRRRLGRRACPAARTRPAASRQLAGTALPPLLPPATGPPPPPPPPPRAGRAWWASTARTSGPSSTAWRRPARATWCASTSSPTCTTAFPRAPSSATLRRWVGAGGGAGGGWGVWCLGLVPGAWWPGVPGGWWGKGRGCRQPWCCCIGAITACAGSQQASWAQPMRLAAGPAALLLPRQPAADASPAHHPPTHPPPLCPQRWVAFQLLHGVMQCHERGVCHGDIKCEGLRPGLRGLPGPACHPCHPATLPPCHPAQHLLQLRHPPYHHHHHHHHTHTHHTPAHTPQVRTCWSPPGAGPSSQTLPPTSRPTCQQTTR